MHRKTRGLPIPPLSKSGVTILIPAAPPISVVWENLSPGLSATSHAEDK